MHCSNGAHRIYFARPVVPYSWGQRRPSQLQKDFPPGGQQDLAWIHIQADDTDQLTKIARNMYALVIYAIWSKGY